MDCKDCVYDMVCKLPNFTHERCGFFKNKADVVEVKHGEWKQPVDELERFEGRYVICSQCNVMLPIITELDAYYYCPNCGAKMDGGTYV